ncbi:hypothetical protein U9M48_024665 [Paspalum notatum var. saurae]|uniref:DUF4218 domain-containing protein n=1 Tax=Paspalum notatum var. saurae TaxID=547442 RepID=A0AAQ3TNS9_PASNO
MEELMQRVKDIRPGKHPKSKKRKRADNDGQCWKRRSCLWDLPYWGTLKLRHNLDVMHIEKNIDGDSYSIPETPYVMNKNQKLALCGFLRSVKFSDGYASNLATCISTDGCNLQGLKTHDCHILLQRFLPAAIRGLMHKDIYEAIAELGMFFQQLCAKTLKLDVLQRMKEEIPIILCKLEKIFPPSLFDVMVHLTVHLPDKAILRGPIQYGWMYPVERRLLTLKRFVRNMARPEGSIAKAYVASECLNACSRYFDDLDTRHNREGRNIERVDFTYRKVLEAKGIVDVEKTLEKQFPSWFKKNVAKNCFVEGEEVTCLVGGVRFHTVNREKNRRTQNSGVMTEGTHNDEYIDFYGCLQDIIQLQYNSYSKGPRIVILFRWDWFDTDSKKARMKNDGYMTSINQGSYWFKNDPFILATQATKVFYLDDTRHGERWRIVQKFTHRHLWSVGEKESEEGPNVVELSYQDDECVSFQVQLNEESLDNEHGSGENPSSIDANVVDELCMEIGEEMYGDKTSEDEDKTIQQYDSDCGQLLLVKRKVETAEDGQIIKQKKYKDVPPTAIDLFKEYHCSSKTEELEAQLEAEKQCSLNIKGTLDSLMQKVDESEVARVRQPEEIENLKNSHT